MARRDSLGPPFATVAMAEILLAQDLWEEAGALVELLAAERPADPRLDDLRRRVEARSALGELEAEPVTEAGEDRVLLELAGAGLRLTWELTDQGLEIGRRAVRVSGRRILRLFTAVAGPRGVRTGSRDLAITLGAGSLELPGVPLPAVHVAAVGFLGNNGVFVPLARSQPVGGAA